MNVEKFRKELDSAFDDVVMASTMRLAGRDFNSYFQSARGHLIKAASMVESFKRQKVRIIKR